VGFLTKLRTLRWLAMDDVELIGVLLHFFGLKGSSSNTTLMFRMSFVSTECASNAGSRESWCGG
jgi:hypothetical protein